MTNVFSVICFCALQKQITKLKKDKQMGIAIFDKVSIIKKKVFQKKKNQSNKIILY